MTSDDGSIQTPVLGRAVPTADAVPGRLYAVPHGPGHLLCLAAHEGDRRIMVIVAKAGTSSPDPVPAWVWPDSLAPSSFELPGAAIAKAHAAGASAPDHDRPDRGEGTDGAYQHGALLEDEAGRRHLHVRQDLASVVISLADGAVVPPFHAEVAHPRWRVTQTCDWSVRVIAEYKST